MIFDLSAKRCCCMPQRVDLINLNPVVSSSGRVAEEDEQAS